MKCRYEGCAEQATHHAIGYQGIEKTDAVYQMCKSHAFKVDRLAEPIQKEKPMNDIDKRLEGITGMIDDLRNIPDSKLSREGCIELTDYIDELEAQLKAEREEKERLEKLMRKIQHRSTSMDRVDIFRITQEALGGDRE